MGRVLQEPLIRPQNHGVFRWRTPNGASLRTFYIIGVSRLNKGFRRDTALPCPPAFNHHASSPLTKKCPPTNHSGGKCPKDKGGVASGSLRQNALFKLCRLSPPFAGETQRGSMTQVIRPDVKISTLVGARIAGCDLKLGRPRDVMTDEFLILDDDLAFGVTHRAIHIHIRT